MTSNRVVQTKLANGLTVLLKEEHAAPIASFWIWYKVGARNEVAGITGISHWVEHMLFKGTPKFPKGSIDRLIAKNGGVMNGFTDSDFTAYFETLPSDRVELSLQIESDRMVNSLFAPKEVAAERTVIISEREGAENSPGFWLEEEVLATAYKVHPYQHGVIGWKCDLQAMTREDLWNHYRRYYAPNNATLVCVGDFKTRQMLALIKKYFGHIPKSDAAAPLRSVEPPQNGERRVVVEREGNTAYFRAAYHVPAIGHADVFPLIILDSILSGAKPMSLFGGTALYKSSRLYRALVETELATDASSHFGLSKDPGLFHLAATVRQGRKLEEVERAMFAEIDRVVAEPVTDEELVKAIKQSKAQFAYGGERVSSQAFWLGYLETIHTHTFLAGYLDNLAKVTKDDVQRAAKTYLTKNNRTTGWFVPLAK